MKVQNCFLEENENAWPKKLERVENRVGTNSMS